MDVSRSGEDNVGIPDDLRCKRSDGKQWRCTARSMPDKTVCEKHYYQAKKRAANSAMRASLKKAKRKSLGESDVYLESKSDDFDVPLASMKFEEHPHPVSGKKYSERASKNQFRYSPEAPSVRSFSLRNPPKPNDDSQLDSLQHEENWRSYNTPPVSGMESSRNRSQRSLDVNAMTVSEYSDQSTESSEETESGGQTCHHCRRTDRDNVIWCLKCDRRGYCDGCISSWYPDISLDDIQRMCPACRGTCNCKVCLRGDNLLKVRIKEIPALDKLLYLHCLLSSVLPIVKQIHHEQCSEVELEKRLREFIYPATWVGDQRLLYRAAEKSEFERSLDPPPLNNAESSGRRRNVNEPVIAFGPPGTSGELNVSVIVSPVPLDFKIEAFGGPKEVGEAIVKTITGSGKRPEVRGTLFESTLREDSIRNAKYYELEFRVESPSFRRHNVAVCCARGGRLFTLNAQAPESVWPEVKLDFQKIAESFSLTS